jgi:hypothetical protein
MRQLRQPGGASGAADESQINSGDAGALASGALRFGEHFVGVLGVAEGQEMRVQGDVARDLRGTQDVLAVDDGVVALGAMVVGVVDFGHGSRIRRSSRFAGFADDLGDVFGERAVGVVFAGERDAEQIIVELEVVESDAGQAECEQAGVERDGGGAKVAVDKGMGVQHLGIQAGRRVDRAVGIGGSRRADSGGGGVELGADLAQPAGKLVGVSSTVATELAGLARADVRVEVDVLGVATSAPAQASGVLPEQLAEDLAVPGAQKFGGHLDRPGGRKCPQPLDDLAEPVNAEIPRLLGGASGRAEERRFLVIAESPEPCAMARAHG